MIIQNSPLSYTCNFSSSEHLRLQSLMKAETKCRTKSGAAEGRNRVEHRTSNNQHLEAKHANLFYSVRRSEASEFQQPISELVGGKDTGLHVELFCGVEGLVSGADGCDGEVGSGI